MLPLCFVDLFLVEPHDNHLWVFNHPSSDPQPIQAASLERYDYLQPRLYHNKSLPLYIPCHPMLSLSFLHQPGRVGQSSKRFAVNVGEGAMGSDREALRYEVPSNKSLYIRNCLFKCSLKRVPYKVLALDWRAFFCPKKNHHMTWWYGSWIKPE